MKKLALKTHPMAKKPPRLKLTDKLKEDMLFKNDRTCCICRKSKEVQIHHIDEDRTNNIESNLCVICSNCHSEAHTGKNLTQGLGQDLQKRYKAEWEKLVAEKFELKTATDYAIVPKKVFQKEILAIEFVTSSSVELNLNDVYVWPDFSFFTIEEGEIILRGGFDALIENDKKNWKIIKGDDLSGKTCIGRKIYLDLIEIDRKPILLNGDNINLDSKGESQVLKAFEAQYEGDFKEFLTKHASTVIIDDANHRISGKLLDWFKIHFKNILIITGESEYISYFREDEKYVGFEVLSIKPLTLKKEEELIENWIKKTSGDAQDKEAFERNIDRIFKSVEGVITKNKIVPRTPFYILSILQTYEGFMPNGFNISAYGHCYQALLTSQLSKKGVDGKDLGACFNFLARFAYTIFQQKGNWADGIDIEQYKEFKKNYGQNYIIGANVIKLIENDEYPVLRFQENIVRFEHAYAYYYFVGKYIAENKPEDAINLLCDQIYKKEYSNILIFTVHHTSDERLLNKIQTNCLEAFRDTPEIKLTTEETKFVNEALKSLPKTIISSRSVKENRAENLKHRESEDAKRDLEAKDGDDFVTIQTIKSFKLIEVLGQILKNESGTLKKTKIREILEQIENLGFRLLGHYLNTIKSEEFINFITATITEHEKEKGNMDGFMNSESNRKFIERQVQIIAFGMIHGMINKIFQSIEHNKLSQTQKELARDKPYPSYEIISLLFQLNENGIKPDEVRALNKKYDETKNAWAQRTLSFLIQGYINTHEVKISVKQSILSEFGIKYHPTRLLK